MIELLNGLYEEDSSGGTPVEKKKFGASVSTLIGDASSDGGLRIANESTSLVFDGVKYVASQALMWKFYNNNITSIEFPDLEKLHAPSCCESAFKNTSVSSVTWSKLDEISGANALYEAFYNTGLASIVIPASVISGRNCLNGAFANSRQLTAVSFPNLTNVGSETTQFDNMLQGVSDCAVMFPQDMESVIGNWTSVQNGFGGTNTTVLFSL